MIALFLHEALDPGVPATINQRGESGTEIDVIIHQKAPARRLGKKVKK
jgi:hypothetical protein